MSSKERIIAAMKRQEVDYIPFLAGYYAQDAPLRKGYSWQFPWGPSKREECEYCVNDLDTDAVVSFRIPEVNPEPDVSSKVWFDNGVIYKEWTTPSGKLTSSVKYNEMWPYGLDIPFRSNHLIGHSIKHWVEKEQDVACLKHIIRPPGNLEKIRFEFMEAKRLADRLQLPIIAYLGYGLTKAMQLVGSTEICMMALDHPGVLDEWLEVDHACTLGIIEIAAELGVDIISRDGFYETCDFYSPDMLENFLGRRLRAEGAAIRQAGMVSTYTINTGVMPMLEYLATLEFDNIFGIDIAFEGMDLMKLQETLGDKFSFWIGPSSVYHIVKDEDLTRQAIRDCFEVFGAGKGFILGPMVSVHATMPWQNTLAMIDEWKKLRGN